MKLEEITKTRDSLIANINTIFDRLIREFENPNSSGEAMEWEIPLSSDPAIFVGKKPTALLFGNERVDMKSWRDVYSIVLGRCNENPQHHEALMYLRDKLAGKCRVFLSGSPDGMSKALKIDEGLYGEVHYGSATLMHILCQKILAPVGFDISDIKVVIRTITPPIKPCAT